MAYARARRHYRATQAQQNLEQGYFIPEYKKNKLAALIIVAALAVFVNGFLIGLFAGRD